MFNELKDLNEDLALKIEDQLALFEVSIALLDFSCRLDEFSQKNVYARYLIYENRELIMIFDFVVDGVFKYCWLGEDDKTNYIENLNWGSGIENVHKWLLQR